MPADEHMSTGDVYEAVMALGTLATSEQIECHLAHHPELVRPDIDQWLTEQVQERMGGERSVPHILLAVRTFLKRYVELDSSFVEAERLAAAIAATGRLPLNAALPLLELEHCARQEPRNWQGCRESAAWALRLLRPGSERRWWAYANHMLGDATEILGDGRLSQLEIAARHLLHAAQAWSDVQEDERLRRALGALDRVLGTLVRHDPARFTTSVVKMYESALIVCDAERCRHERVQLLSALADLLLGQNDLERAQAIELALPYHRETAELLADDGPLEMRARSLNRLGAAYLWRTSGDLEENIERAIDAYQQAIGVLCEQGSRLAQAETEFNLALAYRRRVRLTNTHYAEAERLARSARSVFAHELETSRAAGGTPEQLSTLEAYLARVDAELGTILSMPGAGIGRARIEDAIKHYEAALATYTRTAYPTKRAETLKLLANAVCEWQDGRPASNRRTALRHYREALSIYTREAFPIERAAVQNNLGVTYKEMAEQRRWLRGWHLLRAEGALRAALDVFAVELFPENAQQAARNLGEVLVQRRRWSAAAEAYRVSLRAAEQRYRQSLLRSGKESGLAVAVSLYHDAAYVCAHTAQHVPPAERSALLFEAASILERGRARILTEMLQRDRSDIEHVHAVAPEAYNAYVQAAAQVRTIEAETRGTDMRPSSSAGTVRSESIPETFDRARAARTKLEEAIHQIRAHPECSDFLAEPELRTLVDDEALVYLSATPASGLALLTRKQSSGVVTVEPIWLPDLNSANTRELYRQWSIAYRQQHDDAEQWKVAIDEVTRQLWDLGIGHIAERVTSIGRAVVIPTGVLGLLPLHAAWTETADGRHYAQDDFVWSYAPSAQALALARHTAARAGGQHNLVVDALSHIKQYPSAAIEFAAVTSQLEPFHELQHCCATTQAVKRELEHVRVAHFICHGIAFENDPLASGLVLADNQMLTVRELIALNLSDARLAVLSACETGVIGTDLPDEVVGLSTAMMRAGFAGVLSSLWPVSDRSTTLLMAQLYYLLQTEGKAPADALHEAQRWMRTTTNAEKRVHFARFCPDFSAEGEPDAGIAPDAADYCYRLLHSYDGSQRSFEHPFHWAGFYHLGA